LRAGLWATELQLDEFEVRGAVIAGETGVAVWDTLSHPRNMAEVAPLLGGRDLFIVYSHADWDHIWGTVGLPPSANVIAHTACLTRFSADVPPYLAQKQADQPGIWDDVQLIAPTITFEATYTLDLGGVTLELHALPGHTPDCIVGLIPEWDVLLAGDTVETPLPVIEDAAAVPGWIAHLARWERDERVEMVIPAHGSIGGRDVIAFTRSYLLSLSMGTSIWFDDPLPSEFYLKTHAQNLALMGGSA
jgi:glyoxylase-like metal-dependent hydrolase (beta-lactamase superfamily II)